jgi:protein-disulfide isomerase
MAEASRAAGSSGAIVFAAIVLGAAIAGGSVFVGRSIAAAGAEMASLRAALQNLPSTLRAAAPRADRDAPARRGPDPERRYEISLADAPIRGPESAPITIVEFSDFQCPFCKRVVPTLDQIRSTYGDRVRIAFKHLPLDIHPQAIGAHVAAEAAKRQGKFWEMYERIFANQQDLAPETFTRYARELGLDVVRFQRDVASSEVRARVDADKELADSLDVTGTPGFFVNGRFLSGAQPFESFERVIDAELAAEG